MQPAGVLVMGTVRGDLHDIGKNLVCMMAEGAGFRCIDIGVDQSIEKFLAATELHKPDIIGMSALLTTTMTYMKTVIDGLQGTRHGRHQDWPSAARPSARCTPTKSARTVTARMLRARWICFCISSAKAPHPTAKTKLETIAAVMAERAESRKRSATRTPESKYQILYWQDIPSEIKAWDDFDEIKISLPTRFAERIDASAQKQGLIQADAYMAQLRWSDDAERSGTPQDVAEAIKAELEAAHP